MKNEISVFDLFKNYITEILRECNVIDENQKNIRTNTIIQDILDTNEELDGQEWECTKLMEKIRKSRNRGNPIRINWEQLIRDKIHIDEDFDIKCQTAHCGRCKPHFDFGDNTFPIVPYRHLPQTLIGMTADCRSLV